ncbi:MAG TPA: 50S ribosomal protein L25/general stress protein Ctc [Bacteroidales bacterium]|nr:50S ribosomal protein L25/general stress protein Ctc [Bacteroidales bacterium]
MKTVSLSGSPRENVGKKDAKKQRREGMVPCVMYGGKEQIHFVVEEKNFKKIIFSPEVFIIKINIGGTDHDTVLQDVQYHPVTDKILHVDFLEIAPDKPVHIAVPVKLEGTPVGVLKGGKLHAKMRKVKIMALQADLPDNIVVNIESLDIGDSVKIMNISRDNVQFLDSPNSVIVAVRTARTVVEEVPAEGEAPAEGEEGAEGAEKAKEGEEKGKEGKKGKEEGEKK